MNAECGMLRPEPVGNRRSMGRGAKIHAKKGAERVLFDPVIRTLF
jgi:hypothetical protein